MFLAVSRWRASHASRVADAEVGVERGLVACGAREAGVEGMELCRVVSSVAHALSGPNPWLKASAAGLRTVSTSTRKSSDSERDMS